MLMTSTVAPSITAYQDSKGYWLAGGLARILGDPSDTNGQFSLIHMTLHQGDATPLHIHHDHDEAFFVLHGEVRGVCGETGWSAAGGAFVWLPRGVPHAFQAVGKLPLEVLVMSVPGAFANFVAEAGTPYIAGMDTSALVTDPSHLAAVASRHGIEIVGPPVDFLG